MTWNTSVVDGPIVVPILGPVDGEGVRPVVGQAEGYHLNVARSALPAAAEAFEVAPDPATPVRVFAGDARGPDGVWGLTAFLRFPDEAAAIGALGELWINEEAGDG